MAKHHYQPRYVRDCADITSCELVLFGDEPKLALSCDANGDRLFAVLAGSHGMNGPVLVERNGHGVSFGSDFTLSFDHRSITLGVTTASLGDLVVCENSIHLVAYSPDGGIPYYTVDVNTGAVVPCNTYEARIGRWSISVGSRPNVEIETVFRWPLSR